MNKITIDQFYADVERLSLKFPVAQIAKETSFSKGQVSQYLAKKEEPSENFIRIFYEKFGKGLEINPDVPDRVTEKLVDNITELVKNNTTLVQTNSKQFQIIEAKLLSGNAGQQNQPGAVPIPPDLLVRIIEGGLKSKYWKTYQEGDAIVSRWILAPAFQKGPGSTQNDERNRSK